MLIMNIKSNSYCQFCSRKSKVENGGHYFCPNGHFIVSQVSDLTEPIIEVVQPRSTGNIEGENIFRLNSIKGEFCDDRGVISSSDVKKDVAQ